MIFLQQTVDNWLEAVKLLPNRSLVKTVDQGQVFRGVKAINPDIYTCLRHWYDQGQVFGGGLQENKDKARKFFSTFIDGTFINDIAPHCDFVEEWNEYIATSHTPAETNERAIWAAAAAQVWQEEYRSQPELAHIRLVLANTAVGNNIPKVFFVLAQSYDCLLGYHPYSHWSNYSGDYRRAANDWPDFSGRWDIMESAHGIKVDWLFTEAGPFESAIDGWRSKNCLNGSKERYNSALEDWLSDVVKTPAFREGRIYGFGLFTTDRSNDRQWSSYRTVQPELNQLATTTAKYYNSPNPIPRPDPDPPKQPPTGEPREQYKRIYNVIPKNLSEKEAMTIFLQSWRRGRESVGGSYDDAGIGNLIYKKARLYGLPPSLQQTYLDWYALHYPGTQVTFPSTPPPIHIIWPVDTHIKAITTNGHFNASRKYGLHEGVDLYGDIDDPVLAAADGNVVWMNSKRRSDLKDSDYGNHIIIAHHHGFFTWYGHLSSYISTLQGQTVKQGEHIGRVGITGVSTGPHLHFVMQWLNHGAQGYVVPDVIDPTPYLRI